MIEYRTVNLGDGRIAFVVDDYKGRCHAVIGWQGIASEMARTVKEWAHD